MNEEYFSFGEKEISWLKGRDPEHGTVISRMENPKRKLLPDLFSGLVFYQKQARALRLKSRR